MKGIDLSPSAATHREASDLLDDFLRMKSAPLILSAVDYGKRPVKEITESYAMYLHVREEAQKRGVSHTDERIRILVVGDGTTPRTGAMFAFFTKWSVASIDPLMRLHGSHPTIDRLHCGRWTIQTLIDADDEEFDIVVGVHSHAPMKETRQAVKKGGFLCVMPCCKLWRPAEDATLTIAKGVLSPARVIVTETL